MKSYNKGQYVTEPKPFSAGGMGEIFIGRDTALDREVCIKVVKSDLADSKLYRRRFKREALLMASISHSNVVRIYNYGVNGDVWIAMEKCNGVPIEFHAEPFSFVDAIALMGQMASAIECIHGRGIAHCDIKPENIIKEGDRYILIDFGIGFREDGDESTARTSVRATGGTPIYAPPEQTVGEPVLASDIYSLGCTVYQKLTGSIPFDFNNRVSLANAHATHPRPSAANFRPGCPIWFSDLVQQCMSPDPEDRPKPKDIIQRLSLRQTQDFKKATIYIDPDLDLSFDAVSGLVRRYDGAPSKDDADVVISGNLKYLENVNGKKIYIIDVDDDESIFSEAVCEDVITLIGPVETYEILAAIEK